MNGSLEPSYIPEYSYGRLIFQRFTETIAPVETLLIEESDIVQALFSSPDKHLKTMAVMA